MGVLARGRIPRHWMHYRNVKKKTVLRTYTEWPKKMYTLLQQFSSFDSVWVPVVATSNTYIESKIQGHLISILLLYKYSSYDYRVIFFMSKCVYIFLGHSVYYKTWAGITQSV